MTSTNDGRDVKSNQTSGQKGKKFYLELYNSLEARLSGDSELRQRAEHLCEAWRRIHSICRHASPPSHPHLISWLERHTAKTVLQTDWQRATSKDEHAIFEQAITSVIEEIDLAVADRHGVELPWESQLRKRSEWHKGVLSNPWGHPVLKLLLDSRAQPPSNEQILEWLKEERDAVFTVRLRELVASKCDDLALGITAAIMNRVRAAKEPLSDVDQMDDVAENLQSEDNTEPTFESILRSDAGFSDEVWAFLTDLEFVLLHKGDGRSRCIELAKQTPLRNGNEIIERLQKRLLNARSPRDKKLWKNANDVATLIAQVVIARCMVVPSCSGAVRAALYWCTRALTALLAPAPLRRAAAALAAPAATAQHLYTLARAASRQKNTDEMKPFICELYVRAITSGMNELERLKFDVEKEKEARAAEQTLASWFMELGSLFGASARFRCECTLTAFSVHPSPDMYERIHAAPLLTRVALDVVEPTQADTNSEYGSWATDSRSKTNFVKTSETLNLKQSQHQTNVLSTAIVTEGEALGLGVELCQDIVVLLSGPRVKTLSWDMDRELLLENCRTYMERTHGGTRALTTELKYLNLDPSDYQHLPEEEDDENDLYYGIEKGYEHLVEFQEAQPEAIWDDAIWDSEFTDSASSNDESESISWRKKIKHTYSEEDSDPLSLVAEAKKEKKKERPHSKERKEHKRKPKKERPQNKEKKERKKKEKPQNPSENNVTSLSNLVGMKVSRIQVKEDEETGVGNTNLSNASVTHCDSQGKSSLTSDPYILYPHNTVGNTEVARNKTMLTQIQKDKNISHASTTEQSTVSNVNSSNATIERLNVNEDVKKRIAKLIQFRRQKSSMSSDSNCSLSSPIPQNIQSERSATPNVETNTMRTEPTSSVMNQTVHTDKFHTIPKSDCVTALKQESMSALVGSRIVKESKVSMTKKQTEQLNILKNEANSFLSVSNASQFDNKNSTTQAPDWVSETCSRVREIKYHYINKTKPSLPSQQSSITPIQESQQRPVTPRTYNENSHSKSSYNNQNTLESSSFDAHQKSFQQFLKELQGTINPDVNAPKTVNKSVTCSSKKELKPKSKATPVMATLPKTDITHSPLCAKPVTQQKKAENALNTFSRLSYMHKNKLGETKSKQYAELDTYSQIMLQNSISAELDQRIAELRLSKMKTLQATSDLIISRVSNTAKSEQNARVQVQKIEMQPNRGGTSACTGKPEHFARVEVQRNEMQSSRVGNSAYTAKPEQIARVEVQKNEMQSSRLSNSAYIAKPEQNVRLEVEKLEMHSNRVGPSAKLDHNARMEVQKIESSKLTANRHSVLSSILQVKPTSTLKSPLPKNENTKTFELNRLRTDMKSTPSSSLSERDQQDLILLLRQQSKLNAPLSQARTETNTNKIINHLQLSNTSIKINSPTNRSIPVQSPHASITDMTVNMQNKTPVNANSVTNKILPAQVNTLNKTLVHANNLTSKIIPAQLSHVPVTEKTLKTQKTSININSLNNVQSPLIAVTEKTINTQNVKNVLNNSLHSAVTEKSLHTQFSNIIHNEERNKTSEMTCTKSIRTSEFARNKGGGKTKSKSRKPKTSTTSSSTGIAKVLKIARKKSGTKPRNEGTSKAVVKQDWTKVLDAIRAQKTPSRGPNALDFALKKDSYENFVNERFRTQRIANNRNTEGEFNKATCSNQYGAGNAMISPEKLLSADVLKQSQAKGSPNTNQHESINTPFFTKASAEKDFNLKKDTYDNFASDRLRTQRISKNRNTEGKSLTKTTCPNQHDVGYAKMTTEKLLSTDVPKQNQVEPIKTPNQIGTPEKIEAASSKKFTCGINREADPFISGIPNSDYDLLEELMDDDLRQEIGELSDEERFDAAEALTMKPKASCSTDGGNIAPNKPIAIIPTKLVNDQSKASAINLRSSARVATKKITQEPISQVNFPYVSMSVKSSEDTISKINIPNASTPIKSSVGTTLTKQQFGVTVIKANPHLMCNKQYPIPTKTTLSAQTDSPVNIPVTAAGEIFVNKPYIVSGMPTTWKSQNKMIKTNKAKRNCTSAPSSSSPQIDKPKNNVRSSRNQVKPTCNFNNNITGVTINQSTNNQVRHNNITIDAPILIDVAPQPSLQNMIILNEIVYNPCNTTLQTQETQGHTDSCNVGSHTIVTVDRIANVPILPSTHCAPVIIDAPVTLPVPINDVSIPSVTVPLNITQTTICTQPNLFASTETVLVSSNQMNEIPNSGLVKCSDPDTIRNDIHKIEKISKAKPNNLPVDVGSKSDNIIPDTTIKNSDRKVLSQVQEKQKLSDKFDLKTRLTDDEVKIAHAEGDRLKMKRLAIINRKTNHYIINPPIPLTYAPLAVDKNLNTERRLSHRNKHMKSGLTASELNPANFSKDNLANFETTGKSMERKCCEETEASVQINENFKENKDDVISGNRMLLKPSNTSTNIDVGSVICSKAKGRTKRARLKPTLKRVTKRNRKKNNAEVNIEKYSKSAKNSVNVVNLQNTVDRQENTSNVVMIDNNITTKGVSVVSVRTSKRIRDRKNQKIKVIEEPLISGIVQENNVSSTHNNKITHEVPDNIFDIEEELIKSKINEVKASSITTTSNTSKVRPLLQKTKKTLPQTPNTSSLQRAQKIVSLPEAPKITAMLQQKSRTLPEVPNSALLLKDQKACTLLELPNTPSLDSQKTALLSEGTLGPNIPTEQTVTENEKSVAYDPVKVLSKNAEKGIFLEETIASKKVKALQEDNAVNRDETLHSVLSNIQNKTGNVCSEEITCVPEKICSLSSEPMVKGTPVHVVVETDGYKSVIVKDTDKTDKEPNALDNIILESENGNINEIKSVITFNQDNKNKTTGSIDQPLEVISNENQQSINEDVHEEVDLLSDPNKPQNEEKVDHVGSVLTRKLKDESISITVADDTHCDETIKININSSLVGTVNITNNDVACDTNKVIKRHRKQSKLTRLNKTACRKVEELKKVQHDLNVSSLNSDPERIYRLDRNSGIVEKNIEKNVSHKNQNSELNPDNDDIPLSYKNSISIEELPAEDPHDCTKKSVRIRLPSGKVFKATVFGGVPVSFDSLFKDPALKNILLSGFNDTQRYTLSIQQFSTPSNVIVDTRIKAINIHPKNVHKSSNSLPADVETVNLISDDEEDNVPQKFSTEFGSFAIKSIDNSVLFVDHQNKFSQKCSVKLIRCDSFVNIIANSNTQYYPESGQIDSVINKGDETNSLQNLRDDILFTNSSELSPTDDAINLNSLTIAAFVPEVIEIDDSSNDCAAFNVNVQDDFTNAQSSAKIVELKNQLLRDLGVTQFIEQTTHENDKEKPYANPEYLENPDYSKVITKKCSIKLIRCDKMWEKMKSNEVIIYNTETDNNLSKVSGDIDENVVSEIGLSPTGSFAILNGLGVFEDVIDPVIDTDDRSSPIIDIFQTVAALNDTETDDSIMNRIIDIRPQPEYSMKIIGHFICDSDWFATKSCLRDQSIMSNISIFQLTSTLTGNHLDISTDYDSDNDHIYSSLNLSTKNIQQQCNNLGVLSLRKIMLEYFVDTSNINRLQTTSNVTSSIVPPHKRKMLVDTNNDVANKISKIDFAMALENDNKDTNCAEPVSNRTTDALPKNIEDEDMLFKLQDQLYCESDTIPGSYNCIPMNSKTNSHPEQNQAITKNAKFETKSIEMPAYSLKSLVSRFIVSNLFSVIRYQYKIENNDISSKTGSNDTNFDTEEKSQNKYAKKLLNTSIRITCDSEWYMTKRTLHGLSININIQTASGICQIIENVLSHNKVLETGKTEICLLPIQKNFVEGETTVNNDARDIETENNSINNVCPADDYLMTRLEELADEHTNEITVTVRTIENTSESTKNVSCPTPDSHKILINIHHNPEEKFMENDTVLDNQLAGLTESSEMPSICKIPEISETNDFDKITDSSKGDMVVKEITQFCASECGSKSNNETNNSRETSIGSVHGSKKTLFYDVVEDNHGSNDLKKTERSNFKILQDDFTESKSIPSLIITDFNETPLNPQTNEIIRALYPPEKNENIVLNLSERDQLTFTDGSIIEIENEAMPPVMQKEDKVDMTPVKIKNIDTIQNFTARACNLLNNKKIQVLVVNDVIKASDVIETHDIEELVVEHDNVAIEIVKESAIGNEVPKEIKRNLLIDENKYICETEILAEEITQDEILNNNSVNQEDHSVVDTSSSHVDKESTHVNFGLIESNVDKSEEQETRNTTVETIVSNESFQVLKETHSLVLEKTIDEVSNENVLEKNVTLVYKDDSGVILKGIEYEDPINGTCYVFPLTKSVNINSSRDVFNDGTEDVIQVIQEIDDNEIFDNLPIDDTIQGCNIFADEDLQVTIPKKTYSKSHVKRKLGDTDIGVRKLRRASKYKDIVDARVNEKRYKRGRNIDTTKLSVTAVSDLYYGKEYKRLIEYCSTVKFSYSISFHKEFIDVSALVNDWPINGSCDIEKFDDSLSDSPLFTDTENNPKPLYDPMLYTLAEELDSEFTETEFTSSSMDETNFNMGFGEGSGRVIQNLDKGGDKSKFSAATLSDVKQTQPLLLSEECDCMKDHNKLDSSTKDQIQKVKQYITYIQLHDKIRSFFKKTQEELTQDWIKEVKKDNVNNNDNPGAFPFDYYTTNYIEPAPIEAVVQVVQVGQLPVNAAAQNPVTCDPRVTQVSDASPSQCSVENSPRDDSQPEVKTEYTELTTADLSLPLVQKYEHHDQTNNMNSHDPTNIITGDDIPIETELIKSEVKIELIEDATEGEENSKSNDNDLQTMTNNHIYNNNVEYLYETNNTHTSLDSESNVNTVFSSSEKQNTPETFVQQNGSSESSDQIANAMNAAGITAESEAVVSPRAHALVNISQKIRQNSVNTPQSSANVYSKTTTINAMALQQALAQILPPPLNQTNANESNQQGTNSSGNAQVLHIVQSKNASGNQITLVDNSPQSVISTANTTPVLHIVQNKGGTVGSTSNGTPVTQQNAFSGLSLVDAGLQQGGNQLLHIVNTGNQKTTAAGQLLKRVNLLTNLTNVQGNNEQKMVQFVCKSADGKAIQLNAPHQRSMVLRLQPIESTNVQTPPPPKPSETQEPSNSTNIASSKESVASQQEIKSRSVYEENYAKFIQNSSSKPSSLEKSTSLPKFNQAFGKPVFQEGNQKQNEINSNNSHLPPGNSNTENTECQSSENTINLEHIGQISSPPLLLRKSPAQTTTSQHQANLVQQIKQSITPMNIQTMHGGVIYTRQIPVNIGGGQTINLITVPSTELIDDSGQKQSDVKFVNQGDVEPSIIKIVPQNQSGPSAEVSQDDIGGNVSNDNTQNHQQPVLTQMRIKLPMLSKTPQMVSGARVVRPSFFQIQRNVIGGTNQPVYQQLVLTAAPPLGQQTLRLPQAQTTRQIKVSTENASSETQMSTSTLEQLREFDMVLEQVKERSTVQPHSKSSSSFKSRSSSNDTTDSAKIVTSAPTETTQQVLYSITSNPALNVAYVNRKATVTTPTTSTYVRSPDSSGMVDSPTSSTHVQLPHTVTTESSSNEAPAQPKAAKAKSKSRSKPPQPANSVKIHTVPPKSSQKPIEDEQTTQRILYILAEYKEQVENSPDKDKPAPRRRTNPPTNPSGSSKRKRSGCRRSGTRDMSPVHGEDTRTMGSEDSSCGTSQGDCSENCLESHSPQDSPRKVVRKLTFEQDPTINQTRLQPQRNLIVTDGQTITVARGTSGKPTTAVLMPANYILPVSMVKGGQQIAIVTNRGPKLLTVTGGEGGATNALLLQRLIGPAGLKPVLTRPGVRHVRLPTAALHNLQAFNLATTTTIQPPDSTASPAPAPTPTPTPPELIETRAESSPWADRDNDNVKPVRGASPEASEPWNFPLSLDPHDYCYEEIVRTENIDRTVLDPIPDRYSPDMEAQRIFDKMFDVESKKSYIVDSHDDSPRCGYDIDASDDDKAYHQVVQKKDISSQRQHRLTQVSAAALRHKYAVLEHELRLQKSLSEECEDLGVDSPSAAELFPEAELLFASSPANEHSHEQHHQRHTPQPTILSSGCVQADIDDQIATDQMLHQDEQPLDMSLELEDAGIVTVGEVVPAARTLDHEEFARAHPNTTFHSEPTDEGVIQPYTISSLKARHITFHSSAPATVLMAPQTTVISQATAIASGTVKYADIDNMINSLPETHTNNINIPSVLVKDDGLTRYDNILTDTRELHLSNTASAVIHSVGNGTQVIRRVCYEDNRRERDARYLIDEPDTLIAGNDAKMVAEDCSRDATMESMPGDVDDGNSSPDRNELFWESNSASERSESRRRLDFSSDSDKCCKSPSFDETNSTDSSGVGGAHVRLDSVIKQARAIDRSGSADGSSADDTHPPLRTYPPKRLYHPLESEERSLSGKTRAGERYPDSLEIRRRASGRGVVKRGCHCCNGSPDPPRPKKPRQRKPTMDFNTNN